VTFEDDGTPRAVDLLLRRSGRTVTNHYRLRDIGAELAVDLPASAERDLTPRVAEEDLEFFGHPEPLALVEVPGRLGAPGCTGPALHDRGVRGGERHLRGRGGRRRRRHAADDVRCELSGRTISTILKASPWSWRGSAV
jgi:hypothetical protein